MSDSEWCFHWFAALSPDDYPRSPVIVGTRVWTALHTVVPEGEPGADWLAHPCHDWCVEVMRSECIPAAFVWYTTVRGQTRRVCLWPEDERSRVAGGGGG